MDTEKQKCFEEKGHPGNLYMNLAFSEDMCYTDSREENANGKEKAAEALLLDNRAKEVHRELQRQMTCEESGVFIEVQNMTDNEENFDESRNSSQSKETYQD